MQIKTTKMFLKEVFQLDEPIKDLEQKKINKMQLKHVCVGLL